MISNNTEGNRYHDEDGKFASAPNSGEAKTDIIRAISVVIQKTNMIIWRIFSQWITMQRFLWAFLIMNPKSVSK